jgi:hypothetical protein
MVLIVRTPVPAYESLSGIAGSAGQVNLGACRGTRIGKNDAATAPERGCPAPSDLRHAQGQRYRQLSRIRYRGGARRSGCSSLPHQPRSRAPDQVQRLRLSARTRRHLARGSPLTRVGAYAATHREVCFHRAGVDRAAPCLSRRKAPNAGTARSRRWTSAAPLPAAER